MKKIFLLALILSFCLIIDQVSEAKEINLDISFDHNFKTTDVYKFDDEKTFGEFKKYIAWKRAYEVATVKIHETTKSQPIPMEQESKKLRELGWYDWMSLEVGGTREQ